MATVLGIEGGGTHTVAILAGIDGSLLKRRVAGPANIKLHTDKSLHALFLSLASEFPRPSAIGIGLAGARSETEWRRIRAVANLVWKGVPCVATHDLETALSTDLANEKKVSNVSAKVLLISGTGSCAYGKWTDGNRVEIARAGGWGHMLGDQGSGYDIAINALRGVIAHHDLSGAWPRMGDAILQRLALNNPSQLIPWVQNAEKGDIASLAPVVFSCAEGKDAIAKSVVAYAAESLSSQAIACASKLSSRKEKFQFIFSGSILLKQPSFARLVAKRIRESFPNSKVSTLSRESAWGAVNLAIELFKKIAPGSLQNLHQIKTVSAKSSKSQETPSIPLSEFGKTSPTEQRNPRSMKLDTMSIPDGVELMLSEDAKLPAAILAEKAEIVKAVGYVTRAFKTGGRLFYVGAGTSGRLGVLDASECPPTFRSNPEMVQGIIAGGHEALWKAVEGAEDDPGAGVEAIQFRNITSRDVVMGIAASGRTPFVWGALGEAKKRGATTILLSLNPFITIPARMRPDLFIAPNVGPEILTGSTRLKSGTATKLILNIITTLAMVRIGKVVSNLMVDVNPSNVKLQDRAVRIVRELHNVSYEEAKAALDATGWVIKKASSKLRSQQATLTRKKR